MNRIIKSCLSVWCVLCLLCVWLSGCAPVPPPTLELHILDIGHADCFLIKQGDHTMLIDSGEPEDADRIVSYLHQQGVDRLDAVIMSHPHKDHIGSMERVIKAYKPLSLYYAAVPEEVEAVTLLHTRIFDAAKRARTDICEAGCGAQFALGNALVELYPVTVMSSDANEYSVCARVTYGEERILFTGDASEKAQRALMQSGRDIRATVMKLSHHGAKIDTTRAFLDAVQPKAVFLSCGIENDYGHPHDDTMAALDERGIPCYRTDLHGTVVMTFDGADGRYVTMSGK